METQSNVTRSWSHESSQRLYLRELKFMKAHSVSALQHNPHKNGIMPSRKPSRAFSTSMQHKHRPPYVHFKRTRSLCQQSPHPLTCTQAALQQDGNPTLLQQNFLRLLGLSPFSFDGCIRVSRCIYAKLLRKLPQVRCRICSLICTFS